MLVVNAKLSTCVCKFVLETFINVMYVMFYLGLLYIASYKHNLEFAQKYTF